jgi:hypothetical protein
MADENVQVDIDINVPRLSREAARRAATQFAELAAMCEGLEVRGPGVRVNGQLIPFRPDAQDMFYAAVVGVY